MKKLIEQMRSVIGVEDIFLHYEPKHPNTDSFHVAVVSIQATKETIQAAIHSPNDAFIKPL